MFEGFWWQTDICNCWKYLYLKRKTFSAVTHTAIDPACLVNIIEIVVGKEFSIFHLFWSRRSLNYCSKRFSFHVVLPMIDVIGDMPWWRRAVWKIWPLITDGYWWICRSPLLQIFPIFLIFIVIIIILVIYIASVFIFTTKRFTASNLGKVMNSSKLQNGSHAVEKATNDEPIQSCSIMNLFL